MRSVIHLQTTGVPECAPLATIQSDSVWRLLKPVIKSHCRRVSHGNLDSVDTYCREQALGRQPTWLLSVNCSERECVFYGFGKDHNWGVCVCVVGLVRSQWHSACSPDRAGAKNTHKHWSPWLPSIWRSNQKAQPWLALWSTTKKESALFCLSLSLHLFFSPSPFFLLSFLFPWPSDELNFVFRRS